MKKVVLLIDDDKEDQEIFRENLIQYNPGIELISAFRGKEGLELIPKVSPTYIFLDINMPGMNGLEVLSIIRKKKEYTRIPVFMYSTSDGQRSRPISLKLGATDYFRKPNNIEGLKKIFKEVFN